MRYLLGQANAAELHAIERWLDAMPESRERLENLRRVVQATEPVRNSWDTDGLWERLAQQLEPPTKPTVVRSIRRFAVAGDLSGWWGRGLIAAGLAACAFIGWYWIDQALQARHATELVQVA